MAATICLRKNEFGVLSRDRRATYGVSCVGRVDGQIHPIALHLSRPKEESELHATPPRVAPSWAP